MVLKNVVFFNKARHFARKYLKQGFRDSLRIVVSGGFGGNGLPKFGGIGGQGGDVVVVAKEGITLEDVYKTNKLKKYVAENGRHSTHNFILGQAGESVTIELPVGVTVFNESKKIGELNNEGDQLLVAKGGTGGNKLNNFFGKKGEENTLQLDLKLIADIGLVGFPNAGKSTLLRGISNAKPKVANYPFTTVRPNVGIMIYKDFRQVSVADLPGLIEGASKNKGMGHKFLKHTERTKLLVFIVDINGFRLSPQYPHRSCLDTIILLNKELEAYNPDLVEKPSLLLINKMDTEGAVLKYNEIKERIPHLAEVAKSYPDDLKPEKVLKFWDVIPVTVQSNKSDLEFLKKKLRDLIDVVDTYQREEMNEFVSKDKQIISCDPGLV